MAQKYVEVEYEEFKHATEKAALFQIEGDDVWIPFSQMEEGQRFKKDTSGTVFVTQWIADQNDLVYADG
jgi:hypothetical protein